MSVAYLDQTFFIGGRGVEKGDREGKFYIVAKVFHFIHVFGSMERWHVLEV